MSDWRENERLREKIARLEQEIEESTSARRALVADLRDENAALVAGLLRIRDTACDAAQVARETLAAAGETGEARR